MIVAKSLNLDLQIALAGEIPIKSRAEFLLQKPLALARISTGHPFRMSIGEASVKVESILDIAMLQTCMTDIRRMLIAPRILTEQPSIIDIGANIGCWTAAMKLFLPDASILALEPDPNVFEDLVRNVGSVNKVTLKCCAAGSRKEELTFFRQSGSDRSTFLPGSGDSTSDPIKVEVRTVDDLADGMKVDLIKVDVEGFESEVIRGSEETLRRTTYLLIEISLNREGDNGLNTLAEISRIAPRSRIIRFGRSFGAADHPECVDVLIGMSPE